MRRTLTLGMGLCLALGLAACPDTEEGTGQGEGAVVEAQGPGVDADAKVLRIGTLNDESGPAAGIGKPYAAGKRILAERVNAGGSDLLPEGWRLELVERDHGYNPQRSVQAYNEIHDQVLFIGTSFGTPNTLPLRPMLKRDGLVAFPASLSSQMAEFEYTPPIGTPYKLEAMRALDWAVEDAGAPEKVKAGIVYQQDDYGQDGLSGWKEAAKHHGVQVVSEQAVAPGQTDYAAVVTALQNAGANYVMLTTLPSTTGPLLGTAAQLQYAPSWVGNTPAWIDRFFDPSVIPPKVIENFHWSTGLRYWGEDVGGMDTFLSAYERYGKDLTPPDFYALVSYAQGLVELEAVKRAMADGPLTRESYLKALHTITDFEPGGGLLPPIDLSRFPYRTNDEARVLKPQPAGRTWTVVADYAAPKALAGSAAQPAETEGGAAADGPEAAKAETGAARTGTDG